MKVFRPCNPSAECYDSGPIFFYDRSQEMTAARKIDNTSDLQKLKSGRFVVGDGLSFVLEFPEADPPKSWHVPRKELNTFEIAFQAGSIYVVIRVW